MAPSDIDGFTSAKQRRDHTNELAYSIALRGIPQEWSQCEIIIALALVCAQRCKIAGHPEINTALDTAEGLLRAAAGS